MCKLTLPTPGPFSPMPSLALPQMHTVILENILRQLVPRRVGHRHALEALVQYRQLRRVGVEAVRGRPRVLLSSGLVV